MKNEEDDQARASQKKRMPKWRRRLEEYRLEELVKLTFTTEKDIDEATALLAAD